MYPYHSTGRDGDVNGECDGDGDGDGDGGVDGNGDDIDDGDGDGDGIPGVHPDFAGIFSQQREPCALFTTGSIINLLAAPECSSIAWR